MCVLVVLALLGACSEADRQITVAEVTRCGPAQPPAVLPALVQSARQADFFGRHPLPQLLNQGGRVLRNPRVVAVFFGDDPLQESTEALLQSYGCTEMWREAVAEYGVGDATYERSVVVPSFPAVAGLREFEDWARNEPSLGVEAGEHLYVFYPPRGAPAFGDASCTDNHAFHLWFPHGSDLIPYAVVRECPQGGSPLDHRSLSTTHELMEAAVDPFPGAATAWRGLDWPGWPASTLANENADLCGDHTLWSVDYPFVVASGWSNRRARAGQDPCSGATGRFAVAMPDRRRVELVNGVATVDFEIYSDAGADAAAVQVGVAGLHACVLPEFDSQAPVKDGDVRRLTLRSGQGWGCGDLGPVQSIGVVVYGDPFATVLEVFIEVVDPTPAPPPPPP